MKGLGAILSQKKQDRLFHPIAYASRALTCPEKNYGITELEMLAVVWAFQHFCVYLYGHVVTVVTDYSTVHAVLETPSPSGKHARWWLKLFTSDVGKVNIVYRPGCQNGKADALSRNPMPLTEEASEQEVCVAQIFIPTDKDELDISELLKASPVETSVASFGEKQRKDPELAKIITDLTSGELPEDASQARKLSVQALQFSVIDDILYFVDPKCHRRRAVVPVHLRERIMCESHGGVMAGHFSGKRLFASLRQHWWWETLYWDSIDHCRNYVPNVLLCQVWDGFRSLLFTPFPFKNRFR